jgi:hypothetical protein
MTMNSASTYDTLRELFNSLSFCSNGRISSHYLSQAAEKFGYRLSDKQLEVNDEKRVVYFAFYEKFPLDNAFIMIPWD